MPKKERNLIEKIYAIENLREAFKATSKGKKENYYYLEFKEYSEANLLEIQKELKNGTYKIGDYHNFTIYEPKARNISALSFKDRIVQHALHRIIEPIFEKTMLPYSFACRHGKGTHAAVKHIQSLIRRNKFKYFLKTDFSKYFPSIDRDIMFDLIKRKIDCEQTLKLIREILPPEGKGIPIGSLTSQLFANIYGTEVDRFVHFKLNIHHWARYMDDIVIFENKKEELFDVFQKIVDFSELNLKLKISKWQISEVTKGINFVGYRTWENYKLIRKDSVKRAKKKIKNCLKHNDSQTLKKFLASWMGHIQWADTNNLKNKLNNLNYEIN
jgi:retron-type reverse transcriptase